MQDYYANYFVELRKVFSPAITIIRVLATNVTILMLNLSLTQLTHFLEDFMTRFGNIL